MSFRLQIALFGVAVVGVALLVFSLLVYGLASAGTNATQERDLSQRSERVLAFLRSAGPEAFGPQHAIAPADLADSNDTFVELLDASGAVLSSTAAVNGVPPSIGTDVLASAGLPQPIFATVEAAPGLPLRVSVQPWARPDLGVRGYVVVGQTARAAQAGLAGVRGFLWISGIFTFIAATIAVWLVAGRALRPLHLVATTAEDIRLTGDLGRRLPESRGWVELNRLARAFNGMLERLESAQQRLASALEAQRRFVADASHELRTPLTTVRGNAGLLLQREDVSADDRRAALTDIASEAERMSRLVHDLLTLARADAGHRLERAPLELGPLVAEVARQAQQLYGDCRFAIETPVDATVIGNGDALRQLQWILLDNAARSSGPCGSVRVYVSPGEGWAELRVADNGPGIDPAELERIFDRFYQADLTRAHDGAGLGLSIARWIVEEHGGTIVAGNNPDGRGAVFTVRLPLAKG